MSTITQNELFAKIPLAQLERAIEQFVEPVSRQLPDKRLKRVISLAVRGISAAQSPLITQMARALQRHHEGVWALSKRFYGFLANKRFSSETLLKGLYALTQGYVDQQRPEMLVAAIDPVNFEKPSTHLPGVSTGHKSTPPALDGRARLTTGYPAITATVTNLAVPVIAYANWFSYTLDFVSQNWEIERAIQSTHALFPHLPLYLVGDSGLDDQKFFRLVQSLPVTDCIFRAQHNRCIQVYNERLDQWEDERLFELAAYADVPFSFQMTFTHARREHPVTVYLGWFQIRFADLAKPMWMLIARRTEPDSGCPLEEGELVLLTTLPIPDARTAQLVYEYWRQRPSIEPTYRFDQEQGLDVEDMRVRSLEAMRRLFVLVLLTALLVAYLAATWPQPALRWLRSLGGKLGLKTDLDGLYLLLAGISFVFTTAATLSFTFAHPFPFASFSYGESPGYHQ